MKNSKMYVVILIGLIVLSVQPLNALPAGLYDSIRASLGNITMINGRAVGEQQLTADDGTADDQFGVTVAVDGDTALVGADRDDIGSNLDQGSAYIFVRNGETWTQQAQLIASDGAADDRFGFSVALDGDTALVGAYYHDVGVNSNQGAAYVFVRNGETWTEQTQLTASDGAASNIFGYSVALDGDSALVGAHNTDIDEVTDQGAAYVYVRNGEFWVQQAKLTASDGEAVDRFSNAVALAGDTALLGAFNDDIGANSNQGSAYVFVRSGDNWFQQTKLIASDGAVNDYFGVSVALDGDTALVGAYDDDVNAITDQGSAYVFVRNDGAWGLQAKLTANDGAMGDRFGVSVGVEGHNAIVGAYSHLVNGNADQGSAYVFTRSGTTWTFHTQLTASDGTAGDYFGRSVTLQADTALVGAYYDDVGANTHQGSVYVYTNFVEPLANLVINGDFEAPDVTPWAIKNASGDKAKCNKDKDGDGVPDKIVAYEGNCAFQFKNVVGEAGKLQQNLDLSGLALTVGDTLNLSFYAQSKNGATVTARVILKYTDATKTKIVVASDGAAVYTEFTGSDSLLSTDIEKSKINLNSQQIAGKVYVDAVSVQHLPGSGLIPLPAAQSNELNR